MEVRNPITVSYSYRGKSRKYTLCTDPSKMQPEQRQAYYNYIMGLGEPFSIVPILWGMPLKELNDMDEEQRFMLYDELINNLQSTTDFTFDHIVLNTNSSQLTLVSPMAGMKTSSFGEFWRASYYINSYRKGKKPEDLRKLAACLYLPLENGRRVVFSENHLIEHEDLFRQASAGFFFSILLAFAEVEKKVQASFPSLFPSKSDNPLAFDVAPSQKTWLDVSLSLADNDSIAHEAREKQNMYLVLKSFDSKIKDAEELARKMKQKR